MENQPIAKPIETIPINSAPIVQPSAPIQTKTSLVVPILLTVLTCAAVFGFGGYYLGQQEVKPQQNYNYTQNQPKAIPTITPSPTAASTIQGMTLYQNSKYGFEFQYPVSFVYQETSGEGLNFNANVVLTDFITTGSKELEVSLDTTQFSVNYLKKYAPTGSENIIPVSQTIGKNAFYYYGPGGGGICYPDQYFLNLNGKALIFTFSGCDNDKTPSEDFKSIEQQILSSFKTLEL